MHCLFLQFKVKHLKFKQYDWEVGAMQKSSSNNKSTFPSTFPSILCFGDSGRIYSNTAISRVSRDAASVIMVGTVTCNLLKTGSTDTFEVSPTLCMNAQHIIFVDMHHTLWNHFLSFFKANLPFSISTHIWENTENGGCYANVTV